ncbi:hypothetical protein Hanom_Chr14g01295801 [Helianthus anomalus]
MLGKLHQLSYINILFSRRLVVMNDNLRGLVNFQIQIQEADDLSKDMVNVVKCELLHQPYRDTMC